MKNVIDINSRLIKRQDKLSEDKESLFQPRISPDRLARTRESLEKINALMAELKKASRSNVLKNEN